MEESMSKKEMTMRRNDFRGAKAWIGAILATSPRIRSKLSGRKMSVLLRPVKRRVFDGGVGCVKGGKLERSRVRPDLREADEDDRERRGVTSIMRAGVVCGLWVVVAVKPRYAEYGGKSLMSEGSSYEVYLSRDNVWATFPLDGTATLQSILMEVRNS
uniref:Uncharacterized protein n=1 Tax=Photinus pyralis TaxID=7054 RepID=A0A1Y1LIK7_PHOPY